MPSFSGADLASSQFSAGTRNTVAPASCAASILWVMPPMEPTLPSPSMVPVPATNFAAAEITRGQLVDDGQAEHQTGRRPADIGQVEVDGERRPRRFDDPDAKEAVFRSSLEPSLTVVAPGGAFLRRKSRRSRRRAWWLEHQRLNLLQSGHRGSVDRVDGIALLQLARRRSVVR